MIDCPGCGATAENGQQYCGHCGSELPYVEPSRDPFIGRVVSQAYRVERRLARGGMGEVYLAVHPEIGQRAAVKFLHRRFADDEELAARFLNEARSACKVKHPNAVSIHDFGRLEDGTIYIVMEFVEGRSLAQRLKDDGPMHPAFAAHIAEQVCEVLHVAHEQHVIHRDIKPDNIMIVDGASGRPSVKVLDFGIAKILDDDVSGALTQTGVMFGTPEYMSPEQAAGYGVDPRSDLYSLGIVMYAMLTGHPPFRGKNKLALLQRQIREAPPRVDEAARTAVPEPLVTLVHDLLSKDPAQRPASARETLARLEALRGALGTPPAGGRIERAAPPVAGQRILSHDTGPSSAPSDGWGLGDGEVIGSPAPAFELGDADEVEVDEPAFTAMFDSDADDGFDKGASSSAGEFAFDDLRPGTTSRTSPIALAVAAILGVAVVAGVAWIVLRMSEGELPWQADDGSEPADEVAAVVDGTGEGSGAAVGSPAEAAPAEVATSEQAAAAEPRTERREPAPERREAAAAPAPGPSEALAAQIDDARRALEAGRFDQARTLAREASQRPDAAGVEALGQLQEEIGSVAQWMAAADRHLAAGECLRADEFVVRIQEEVSRALATPYYGRLEACRLAQAAEGAAAREPDPEPADEPIAVPDPEPATTSGGGAGGNGGGRTPPREL